MESSPSPDERCLDWLESLTTSTVRWGCFSALNDPFAAETLARIGYEWVLVDLQHGMADMAGLPALLQAIEGSGAAPLVRVTSNSPAEIGRALDLGAWAVVVPMVETAAEAAAAVASCSYGSGGSRSFGPIRGRAALADYPRCLAMVETSDGLANVDEICAVDGLLGVFVGPSDLAIGLGLDVDYEVGSGAHHEAIQRIADAANSSGVVTAIQTAGATEAALRASQGYRLVSMRSDWLVMRDHMRRMLDEARSTA